MSDIIKELSHSYTLGITKAMDINNNISIITKIKPVTISSTWKNIGNELSLAMNEFNSTLPKENSIHNNLTRIQKLNKRYDNSIGTTIGSRISKQSSVIDKITRIQKLNKRYDNSIGTTIGSRISKQSSVIDKITRIQTINQAINNEVEDNTSTHTRED